MSAMKDLSIAIAESVEAATGRDFFDVMDALLAGRVRLGARNAAGGVMHAAAGSALEGAVLSLVASGAGLVASLDGGGWVDVRELRVPVPVNGGL